MYNKLEATNLLLFWVQKIVSMILLFLGEKNQCIFFYWKITLFGLIHSSPLNLHSLVCIIAAGKNLPLEAAVHGKACWPYLSPSLSPLVTWASLFPHPEWRMIFTPNGNNVTVFINLRDSDTSAHIYTNSVEAVKLHMLFWWNFILISLPAWVIMW